MFHLDVILYYGFWYIALKYRVQLAWLIKTNRFTHFSGRFLSYNREI
jgi:hypothetical protein